MSENHPDDNAIDVVLLVTTVLEDLNVTYYISGSVAGSLYGKVRTTHDIDLVADVRPEHIEAIVEGVGQHFYVDPEMISDAIRRHSMFNLIHNDSIFKVDIFIPRTNASVEERYQRRRRRVVASDPERHVYVSSPEDVILSKLEWYELGHRTSDRQWMDIVGIIEVQAGTLDRGYLNQWAAVLRVSDLLDRAYHDAET